MRHSNVAQRIRRVRRAYLASCELVEPLESRCLLASSLAVTSAALGPSGQASASLSASYFAIRAVDSATARGVPMVEFVMTDGVRYFTDSNGYIAFNRAKFINTSVTFTVQSYGYTFAPGTVTFTTTLGQTGQVSLTRNNIAERLYRVTGQNIYADSQLLGAPYPIANPLNNAGVDGQDTVQTVIYKNKLYWFFGDTVIDFNNDGVVDGYNFRTTGATSDLPSQGGLDLSDGVDLHYFVGADGRPKAMIPSSAAFPDGYLYWVSSPMDLRDNSGNEKMLIVYTRQNGLTTLERGLAVWNDAAQQFDKLLAFPSNATPVPNGHVFPVTVGADQYFYFETGLDNVRVKATWNDVTNINSYQTYTPLKAGSRFTSDGFGGTNLTAADIDRDGAGKVIYAWKTNTQPLSALNELNLINRGLITRNDTPFRFTNVANASQHPAFNSSATYWNEYRKVWSMVGEEIFGTSFAGEIWYAEAPSPDGPWVNTIKVMTHARSNDTYTYYNLWQHPEFTDASNRYLYFEGTYTDFLTDAGLTAQYFDNSDLTGFVFERQDSTVNFNWGAGSPGTAISSDTFSARWTGQVQTSATSGTYQFHVTADDGVRLWVNNVLLIDQWHTVASATSYTGSISLAANTRYDVKLEYFENTANASIKLEWTPPGGTRAVIPSGNLFHVPTPDYNYNQMMYRLDLSDPRFLGLFGGTGLTGQYFDNSDLTGLKKTTIDGAINFNWGAGSPDPSIAPDSFSARWAGLIEPKFSESYSFITTADDGVRLWVDGQLLIDRWTDRQQAGDVNGDGQVNSLDFSAIASHFNSSGMTRTEGDLSGDGVVNALDFNTLATNFGTVLAPAQDIGTISLLAGKKYDIRLEYYEDTGDASVVLEWQSASQLREVIPSTHLYQSP
jgi:hypothetical protein